MKVTLTIGRTINLGNYESARVDIGADINEELLIISDLPSIIADLTDKLHAELHIQLQKVIQIERNLKR